MRDQDAGGIERLVQRADQVRDGAQRDRIKARKRLVIHQQRGIQRHRAGQRHPARHAAGNLRRHQMRGATQPHRVQLHQHQVADHRFGQIGLLAQREGHVVEDAEIGEQRAELEQHAHVATHPVELPLGQAVDIHAIEQDAAFLRAFLGADEAQHRGLARPRATHQGHHRPALERHRDVVQDQSIACIAKAQRFDGQKGIFIQISPVRGRGSWQANTKKPRQPQKHTIGRPIRHSLMLNRPSVGERPALICAACNRVGPCVCRALNERRVSITQMPHPATPFPTFQPPVPATHSARTSRRSGRTGRS